MNDTPVQAPYGSWASPITPDLLLSGKVALSQPAVDGEAIYWVETRPLEGGRNVVVRWVAGRSEDVTPPGFNVRTRVHEYGGGDYAVGEGVVYFANDADQRVYRQRPGEPPEALTPEPPAPRALRYADFAIDAARNRLICVREDHRPAGREAINTLVAVPLGGGEPVVLVEGADFYAAPRLSPGGAQLAWLGWPGITPTCPGTARSYGRPRRPGWRATARSARGGGWPVGPTNRSSSPTGRPTGCCISSPTAAAGGISTGWRAIRPRRSTR